MSSIRSAISDKIYSQIVTNFFRSKYHGSVDSGTPGSLYFVSTDTLDTIEVPQSVLSQLSTEQQTDIATQGNSWAGFSALYAWASVKSWFNTNVIGRADPTVENYKTGLAFYSASASQRTLNKGLVWFGYEPVTVYWQRVDETNILRTDGTPIEVQG